MDDFDTVTKEDIVPRSFRFDMLDIVLTHYDLESLPTGTLIVSLGSAFRVQYHSNDLNFHIGFLVWSSHDGNDTLFLHYEPGKTRPLVLELDVHLNEYKFSVVLNHLSESVSSRDYAYKPRQEVINHPRYLQSIEHIMHIMIYTHFSNDSRHGFKHKWQPKIWTKPELNGYSDLREYYSQLAEEENILLSAFRQRRRLSSTCVDVIMIMVSLLHESLYINLTPEEIAEGKNPAPKKILTEVDEYDVSRFISPESEMYEIYEKTNPSLVLRAVHTHVHEFEANDFFYPFIVGILVFIFIFAFMKPMTHLIFGTKSLIKELVASSAGYSS